jgi:superfamily I DNA/RNA helicase
MRACKSEKRVSQGPLLSSNNVTTTIMLNKKPLSSDASEQEGRISQDNADAITLCSIHGAKGREWSIVFGVRFNEGD